MSRASSGLAAPDKAAFHAHIDVINRRRIMPLAVATAVLLFASAMLNLAAGVRVTDYSFRENMLGFALCLVVMATARWSTRPALAPLVYGYAVLFWGDSQVTMYLAEVIIRHPAHAAQQYVLYYVTRYLASVSIVWRPRDLFVALLVNHVIAQWPVIALEGVSQGMFFPAIWTATAFIAAFLIYRAERDAFFARAAVEKQRDDLVAANQNLERLNQEKNDLMAIAAHDLRSPLMGMSTLLRMTIDDASRVWAAGVDTLRALEQSSRDMADLVTRVLDVHKAEDGIGALALASQDIRPVVTRAIESHQPRAGAKAIEVLVKLPDQPCVAIHDESALSRVLDNLVSNAIKFSPRGSSVRIEVTRTASGATITVSDSGPGITLEERPKLFRKFARLKPKPTAGESSSGLGLYITKKLADAMGGTIAIADGAGGATFVVTLR